MLLPVVLLKYLWNAEYCCSALHPPLRVTLQNPEPHAATGLFALLLDLRLRQLCMPDSPFEAGHLWHQLQ